MPERSSLPAAAAALVAGIAVMAAATGLGSGPDAPGPTRLAVAVGLSSAGLGLIALAGAWWSGAGVADALGLGRGRLGTGSVALLALGTVGTSHLLDAGIDLLGLRHGSVLVEVEDTIARGRGLGWLTLGLGLAIAPGLGEELLFRGLVLRRTAAHYGAAAGVAVSSLLFGVMHLDVAQSPAAAILGVYLAAVAVASGSVRAAVVCHVANNLAVLLAIGLGVGGGAAWLAAAALACAAGCRVLFQELRELRRQPVRRPPAGGAPRASGAAPAHRSVSGRPADERDEA